MIKAKLGDRGDRWIHSLFPFLFRRRIHPNLFTVGGTCLSLAAAGSFAAGWFTTAGMLIVAGGLFDAVDGAIARHQGVSTRFGAFLDSTLDRLSDMVLLLGVSMYFAMQGEVGVVLLAGTALMSTVLVSYSQARAELSLPSFRVGLFERAERIAVLAAGALFGLMVAALWIIAIGSTITVIQRIVGAYREMERIDADESKGLGEHH